MLHWLAGQRPGDRDHDDHLDPPETPAPLFAVRAFKQAIFGTPAPTASPRLRRSSTHDRETARSTAKPSRPLSARPRSANDADSSLRLDELPPSPTKGILLTPGTIGERRKTVTFGDFVPERSNAQGQKELDMNGGVLKRGNPFDTRNGRDDDRDSKSRKYSADALVDENYATCARGKCKCSLDDQTFEESDCVVGRHWKREYDLYRENTSRELRKLVTKQQAAKNYAREKDEQCSTLADDLRVERRKVDRLENRTKELETMLDELRAQLDSARVAAIDRPVKSLPRASAADTRPARTARLPVMSDEPPQVQHAVSDSPYASIESKIPSNDPVTADVDYAMSAHISKRRARRHDSFEPGSSFALSETKPQTATPAVYTRHTSTAVTSTKENIPPTTLQPEMKSITNKDGEVIPPDRVAAARARLAARRQQRIAS